MSATPVPAVAAFYCAECKRLVAQGEPVHNAGNRRICALCWSKPKQEEGGRNA